LKPLISEFSYGYALTEELVTGRLGQLTAAPVFPSLISEGRAGGGFDVKIPTRGLPMYLQFKLADYLSNRRAREWNEWQTPYFRVHLHSRGKSDQHKLLIKLERKGNRVFYAAPCFHRLDQLNSAYLSNRVYDSTAFLSPLDIGPLQDDEEHYVAFIENSPSYLFCSKEPRRIKATNGKELFEILSNSLESNTKVLDADFFGQRLQEIIAILSEEELVVPKLEEIAEHYDQLESNRIRYATMLGYMSRAYLNAELYIVARDRAVNEPRT